MVLTFLHHNASNTECVVLPVFSTENCPTLVQPLKTAVVYHWIDRDCPFQMALTEWDTPPPLLTDDRKKKPVSEKASSKKSKTMDNVHKFVQNVKQKKILSTPSFGGEVKPSVPCRRFAACKRSLNLCGSRNLGKITDNFSPTVPLFVARISRVVSDVQAPGGESGNV